MSKAIVIICDNNFVAPAVQTIKSIKLYGCFDGDIVILTTDLTDENRKIFQDLGCEIKVQSTQYIYNSSDYPDIVLLKYFLFSKFFTRWDKVMYLDADTLVISDISALFFYNGFNAVYDCSFSTLGTQIALKHIHQYVPLSDSFPEIEKYDLGSKLFNVGFFVFDTDIIHDNMYEELLVLNNLFSGLFSFPEQPILNIYFQGKINFLPIYYNNYVGVFDKMGYSEFSQPYRQYGILHFCGKFKHYLETSPYYELYQSIKSEKHVVFNDIDLDAYQKNIIKVNLEIGKKNTEYSDYHKCFYIKHAPISYKYKKISS